MPTVPGVTGQNPYDDLIDQQQAIVGPTVIPDEDLGQGFRTSNVPQAPGVIVNPYDKVLDGGIKRTEIMARMAALDSSGKNPEQYAEWMALGQDIGLPVQAVENDPEQAKQIQRLNRWAKMAQESPQVAAWMAIADNGVLAQDDIEALTGIEKLRRGANDVALSVPGGLASSFVGPAVSGIGDLYDGLTVAMTDTLRAAGAPQAIVGGPDWSPIQVDQEGWWMNPANWFRAVGDPITKWGAELVPEERQNYATDVTGGLAQLVGQIALTRINPMAAVAANASIGAEQQGTRAEQSGSTPQQKAAASFIGAGITAAVERFGVDMILERVPPQVRDRTLRWIVDRTIAGGIEGGQEAIEQIANNQVARSIYDPSAGLFEGTGDSAAVGFGVGFIARAIFGGRMRDMEANQSRSEQTTLNGLVDLASQTKLRQLAPDKFRDLMGRLQGDQESNVYVDAQQFNQLYQSKGLNPETVAAEFGVDVDAFRIATLSEGEIAIPLANYVTKIEQGDHAKLSDFAKLTAGGLTPAEATLTDETIARQADIIRAGIEAEVAGDNRIRDDIVGMTIGRFGRDTAEKYGTVMQAAIRTMATRQGIDPFQLYSRYRLRVKNQLPGMNAKPVDTLLDPLIERLRAGEIPTERQARGETLAEFLAGRGGINDEALAGEIRSLQESDRATRRGKVKLVRDDAKLTLDGAREAAVEAGYLPADADINDLLAALTDELVTDRPMFAPQNENARALNDRNNLLELDEEISRRGIDLKTATNEDIKRVLMGAASEVEAMYAQVGDVGTESFNRWFRQSKVVDAEGRPLVVYHGTGEEFRAFDERLLGNATGHATSGLGFFFGVNRADAEAYADKASDGVPANAVVLDVYLSIQNPYTMTLEEAQAIEDKGEAVAIRQWLQSQGYDGIFVEGQNAWVAFEATQVKSVNNIGTWSLVNPDMLAQVSVEQAMETNVPVEMPSDPLFAEAVGNTAGAEITADGLLIDLVRFQKPEQEGAQAIRTGVFYLPAGSANAKHYRSSPGKQNNNPYGGTEKMEGQALIRRPLFVKGATGGKAPEAAYDAINGKGAMKKLDSEVMSVISDRTWMTQRDPIAYLERVQRFLSDNGGDPALANAIIRNSTKGNTLRYALQEHVIAHAVRAAGYDAVVGYSKGKAGASISEVFDVREQTFPARGMDSQIHSAFYQSQPAEQTQTPEFKRWSEGAPLVQRQDADRHGYKTGEPVVVRALHGTPDGRFMESDGIFKGQREKFGMPTDGSDRAFWFSTSDSTAKTYADPKRAFDYQNAEPAIVDGFVKMMNPLVIDGGGKDWRSAQQRGRSTDVINQARQGGHDGVIITNVRDDYNNTARTKTTTTYVVFSSNQIKSATNNDGSFDIDDPSTLSQSLDDTKRGGITGFDTRQFTITMFEKADASTFLHESAHFFVEVMNDLVKEPNANPQLVEDFRGLVRFGGADPDKWDRMTLAQKEDAHERIARGFEAYLREGKAPSAELAGAFERFRGWLKAIYQSLRQLNVELTDEVRGIFDRMLATDAEIERTEADNDYAPLFREAAAAGLSEAKFRDYMKLMQDATREARDSLAARAVRDVYRERDAWWKEEAAGIRAEVEAEVNQSPLYRAWYYLAFGTQPDGSPLPEGMEKAKLDKGWLVQQYGQAWLNKNLLRKRVYAVEGGGDPDLIAAGFGFESGDAMVQALANAQPRKAYINDEVSRRMIERHGDLVSDDGQLSEAAQQAVHNSKRMQAMETEMAILARLAGEAKGTTSQIRRVAESMVARMKLRDITPGSFLRSERKNAKLAQDFAAKGQYAKALEAKRKQILNAALYDTTIKAKEEGEKVRDYVKRFEKTKLRERLGKVGRLNEVDALLDAYDLRRLSGAAIDRGKAQGELLAAIKAGLLTAPKQVIERMKTDGTRTNYRELTMENLRGLRDVLRQLEKEARNEYEALLYGEKIDLDQKADEMAEAILAAGDQATLRLGQESDAEAARRYGKQALSAWLRPAAIARLLDGSDNGPMTRLIIQPIRDAVSRVLEPMKVKAAQDLADLYSRHYSTKEMAAMNERTVVPGLNVSLSRWDVISIAMNWGNAENREALLRSVVGQSTPFTQAGIEQALGTLNARDWAFVQDGWDYIDSYWPQIKAAQERRRGISPPKVEALPFEVRTADGKTMFLRGGYYPLRYNGALDARSRQNEIDDAFEKFRAGTMSAVQSKYGHTQERVGSGGQPVTLSMNVMHQHVNNVIQDIALGDVVNMVDKLLKRQQVRNALLQTGNLDVLETMRLWLKDVSTGELAARNGAEKTSQFLRRNFTLSKIGFNVVTALLGVSGLTQSAAVVGSRWMFEGAKDYSKNPKQAIAQVMDQSNFMRLRYEIGAFNKDIADFRQAMQNTGPVTKSGGFLNGLIVALQKAQMPPAFADAAFWMIRSLQMQVDTATWLAGYHKAKGQGMPHDESVRYADGIVENAQTSGLFSDRSGFERGTFGETTRQAEFVKIWTTLGSYMIAKGNIAFESYKRTDFRNPAQVAGFMGDIGMLFFVEMLLAAAIRGTWPGEEEEWWWWATKTGGEQMLATVPIVREIPSAIKGFGGGGGPLGAFAGDIGRVVIQTSQAEVDASLLKAYVNMIGTLTGAPAAQTNRAIDAAWAEHVEGEDVNSYEYILGRRPPEQ